MFHCKVFLKQTWRLRSSLKPVLINQVHVGKSLENTNKGTTSSCYNTLVTGIWMGTSSYVLHHNPQNRFPPLQEGFLCSQDDERRGKWFVSIPSQVLRWFITLKFSYSAGESVSWLIPSFSNHALKNWYRIIPLVISILPIIKKQVFNQFDKKKEAGKNSFSFKGRAAELLACFHWL